MGTNKITVYKGDDIGSIVVTIKDENGDPIDISTSAVYFTVKTTKTDLDAAALIGPIKNGPSPNARGTAHSDPTNGETTFNVTHTETDITAGTYYYDVQLVTAGSIVTTLIVDEFEIVEEVTDTIT